jgi:hypothetical protein
VQSLLTSCCPPCGDYPDEYNYVCNCQNNKPRITVVISVISSSEIRQKRNEKEPHEKIKTHYSPFQGSGSGIHATTFVYCGMSNIDHPHSFDS